VAAVTVTAATPSSLFEIRVVKSDSVGPVQEHTFLLSVFGIVLEEVAVRNDNLKGTFADRSN